MNMAAILVQVFSPATWTQCPNMGNEILISMQQFRSTQTIALVRKKSTGSLISTIAKVLQYILISLIFISISCRFLFEYTLFTAGKLIMCRTAADFVSSMMVSLSRMVSFFLIAMIYDLLSRFLWNILFFTLFFAVPSRQVDFIAQNIILFERRIYDPDFITGMHDQTCIGFQYELAFVLICQSFLF
jgi:hypothetical protein